MNMIWYVRASRLSLKLSINLGVNTFASTSKLVNPGEWMAVFVAWCSFLWGMHDILLQNQERDVFAKIVKVSLRLNYGK